MQGTWIWSLAQEDPTCHRMTKPMCCNYWAHASWNYWSPCSQWLCSTARAASTAGSPLCSLCAAAKTQCGQKVRDFSKRNGVRNFRLLGWLDSSQELWPGSSGSGAGRHSSGGCDPEQVTLYLPSEQSVQTLTSSFLGTYWGQNDVTSGRMFWEVKRIKEDKAVF